MAGSLSMLTNDRFYYRGYDALALATTHSVEQVASLIWTGDFAAEQALFSRTPPGSMLALYQRMHSHLNGLTPLEAFQVCLPLAALDDIAAYDLRPEAVAQTGARILQLLAIVAAGGRYNAQGIAQARRAYSRIRGSCSWIWPGVLPDGRPARKTPARTDRPVLSAKSRSAACAACHRGNTYPARRASDDLFRAGYARSCAEFAAGWRDSALRIRKNHRLDRPQHRAISSQSSDSTARPVRRACST